VDQGSLWVTRASDGKLQIGQTQLDDDWETISLRPESVTRQLAAYSPLDIKGWRCPNSIFWLTYKAPSVRGASLFSQFSENLVGVSVRVS